MTFSIHKKQLKSNLFPKIVFVLILFFHYASTNAQKLYFVECKDTINKIFRCDPDGNALEEVVSTGLAGPRGLAIDTLGQKLYWTDKDNDRIQRSDLDGTNVEDLVTGLDIPFGIRLDLIHNKMYWVDYGSNKIQRANLDGTNVEDLIVGMEGPRSIALDIAAEKMYWTERTARKIQRANLDGTQIEDLIDSTLNRPYGLDLDISAGKMYWSDTGNDDIRRANLDGSNPETLISTGLDNPAFLRLRKSEGKLYFTDSNTGKVSRCNLDGSNVQDIVTVGILGPRDIAFYEGMVTSLDPGRFGKKLKIFPNPAENEVQLVWYGNGFISAVRVVAPTGAVIFQSEGVWKRQYTIPTHEWETGRYYARTTLNTGKEVVGVILIER